MSALITPPAESQDLALRTRHRHQDPLVAVAAMDLCAFSASLDEIDRDLAAEAAAAAGGRNPQEVTARLDRALLHLSGEGVASAVIVLAVLGALGAGLLFVGAVNAAEPGVAVVLGAAVALALLVLIAVSQARARLEGVVAPSLFRMHLATLTNPTVRFDCGGRYAPWSLRSKYEFLPRGDRDAWLQNQLRWQDNDGRTLDLETGQYCYETRHEREVEDEEGNKRVEVWFTTSSMSYLHVPLPQDILDAAWVAVHIRASKWGPKLLSAAFDRVFSVEWSGGAGERLQVVKQLAPDFQIALLAGFAHANLNLHITNQGALLLGQSMPAGWGGGAASPSYRETIAWLALALHEMFEQINPAYKLPITEKGPLLKRLGLPQP